MSLTFVLERFTSMRVWILTVVVVIAATWDASAQSSAWADKLFGGALVHDFQSVPHGAQLKHSFKVTNIYKVPLDITNVRVSCGCVTVLQAPKHLLSGESGTIDINMDAARFTGPKTVDIYVTVGPEFVSTAKLTVTANIRQDVVFNPGEIDFGLVQRGQAPVRSIDIEYAGTMDWRVSEVLKSSKAPFELKSENLTSKFRGYRLVATLKADAAPGVFREEIVLKTNDPSAPVLSFFISGNVQATLRASPQSIALAGKVGETQTKKIIVSGVRPFHIVGVDGAGDDVSVQLPTTASTTQVLEIRFVPSQARERRLTLNFRTDLDNEMVAIQVDTKAMQ